MTRKRKSPEEVSGQASKWSNIILCRLNDLTRLLALNNGNEEALKNARATLEAAKSMNATIFRWRGTHETGSESAPASTQGVRQ
jgi:hypothetical protein